MNWKLTKCVFGKYGKNPSDCQDVYHIFKIECIAFWSRGSSFRRLILFLWGFASSSSWVFQNWGDSDLEKQPAKQKCSFLSWRQGVWDGQKEWRRSRSFSLFSSLNDDPGPELYYSSHIVPPVLYWNMGVYYDIWVLCHSIIIALKKSKEGIQEKKISI